MSFREKSTWVTFVLLLGAFAIYFANVFIAFHGSGTAESSLKPHLFPLFFTLVMGIVVLEIVMHIILGFHSFKDAKTPKDEREKLIELKAIRPAFYVLLFGGFLIIGTLHLGSDGYHMAYSVLFVVWIAEIVRYGMQLFYFRRGV